MTRTKTSLFLAIAACSMTFSIEAMAGIKKTPFEPLPVLPLEEPSNPKTKQDCHKEAQQCVAGVYADLAYNNPVPPPTIEQLEKIRKCNGAELTVCLEKVANTPPAR